MDPVKSHDRPVATVVVVVGILILILVLVLVVDGSSDTTDCPVPTAIESGSS